MMKRKAIIEKNDAIVVDKTRVLLVQIDSAGKVLARVYELHDNDETSDIRVFN